MAEESAIARYDFELKQGASYQDRLIYQDENGVAISLAGCTARMQVRASFGAPDVLLDLTTANNGLALNVVPGAIDINITAVQTAAIEVAAKDGVPPVRPLVHDLLVTFPDGHVEPIWEGVCPIKRAATVS